MKKAKSISITLDIETQFKMSQTLIRIVQQLNRVKEINNAVENLMTEFMGVVGADEGAIQLLRPASTTTRCTLVRQEEKKSGYLDQRFDDFLTGMVLNNNAGFFSNNIPSLYGDIGLPDKYLNITSIISSPLLFEKKIIGVVNLLKTDGTFSEIDFIIVKELAEKTGEFIETAHIREQLFAENEQMRINLENRFSVHGLMGDSVAIKKVYSTLERIIPTDARVVILGESGTGKELVAKCIHYTGPRKDKPFVALDCGALPTNLLESELFGYVRGAFTGAMRDRKGLIEHAHDGTLFLDEITNMAMGTQAKLLRVIQEGEIRPLGANETKKVDVRIIVAASQDLTNQVSNGKFRSDLYYRLNVIKLQIPPLRERIEDIPILAKIFLQRFSEKHGKQLDKISPQALQYMEQYKWPGNIRELENIIERAVVMTHYNETELIPSLLPNDLFNHSPANKKKPKISGDHKTLMEKYEADLLREVLSCHNWNKSAAARALNISEGDIRYKMKKLDIGPTES